MLAMIVGEARDGEEENILLSSGSAILMSSESSLAPMSGEGQACGGDADTGRGERQRPERKPFLTALSYLLQSNLSFSSLDRSAINNNHDKSS